MNTKRFIIAVLAAALCCWGIWQATRIGYARTLDEYAAQGPRDNVVEGVLAIAGVNDPKAAVDRAYAEKFPTPGSRQFVEGFKEKKRRDTTTELAPAARFLSWVGSRTRTSIVVSEPALPART